MTIRRPGAASLWSIAAWRALQLLAAATLAWATWKLLGHTPYRIDIDVYRMGGRAWLDDAPLYRGGVLFHTQDGLDLPFTYPPLAAVAFAPFAVLSLPAASAAITATTLVLLLASTWTVLTRLGVAQGWVTVGGSAWRRRGWLAVAVVGPAVLLLEPIRSNFAFGQINVVLMTLVIADLVPVRTPWPRGVLLGVAMALKLTPAVFLLYVLLRRDTRTLVVAGCSAVIATLAGLVLAPRDSLLYWTETVHDTDRIGTVTFNTNQNIAGALARLGIGDGPRFALWAAACLAVLTLTVWTVRRVLAADQPVLGLACVALFGLVVSPVSWSHHWVWALPSTVVTVVTAIRFRNVALGAVSVLGVVLMVGLPWVLLPQHHESAAAAWRQLMGGPYPWWALTTIAVAGAVAPRLVVGHDEPPAVHRPGAVAATN